MKKLSKKTIVEIVIILILGLAPILWFGKNEVILGHDAGLTINPVPHFFDRLFVWTERYGFGDDQTYAIAGFFIHGLEALIATFHFDLQTTQKIFFIFWFVLPGLTMYYYASRLAKKLQLKYFVLPTVIFYMFNHFLLQGWTIAERTKFSLFAALPLLMSFLFDWEEKQKSTLITAILMSLTLFFLNGEGSLPLFGGIIVSILVFIIFYFVKEFSFKRIRHLLGLFILFFCFYGLLNSYWLLPDIWFILKNYSQAVAQAGGEGGVLGWLDYISGNSSLINLLRLQGVPEWYNNSYHPYANRFLFNPFLVFVGFVLPVLAFIPLRLYKELATRKVIIFYSFLALFSLIFIGGSHPPFGAIYLLLFKFIPGFIAFRTPFYKFAPALWFSYAILIGFTINYFITRKEKSYKIFSIIVYGFICIAIILYSYPLLTGVFFNYQIGVRSMKVKLPQYVVDFGKFSEASDRREIKTLLLPPQSTNFRADVYTWGYWSLTPLTSLLSNASFISINGATPQSEKDILEKLYKEMKYNDPSWITLAHFLGIKSFLIRKDFVWNVKDTPTDNPLIYENVLINSNLKLVKRFGQWDVYDFNDQLSNSRIYTSQHISFLEGNASDLGAIASFPLFNPNEPIFVSSSVSKNTTINSYIDNIYLRPKCIVCNLEEESIDTDLYRPLFTKGSFFYFLNNKIKLEKKSKDSNVPPLLGYYLAQSLSDLQGFKKTILEKNGSDRINLALKEYNHTLDSFNKALNTYIMNYRGDLDNDFLIHAKNIEHIQEKIFLDNFISFSENITSQNDLYHVYNVLQIIKNSINKNIWMTTDEIHKRFLVVSPKDQTYTLLYRKNESIFDTSTDVNFLMDGQKYKIRPNIAFPQWFSLGDFFLTKGSHKLEIEQQSPNLYSASTSAQAIFTHEKPCFTTNAIKGYKDDNFKITFRYRTIQGRTKRIFSKKLTEDIKPNPLDPLGEDLENSPNWNLYTSTYKHTIDGNFYLEICKFPEWDESSENTIMDLKDITMIKLTVPDLIFYSLTPNYQSTDAIMYKKKSSTEYVATIQNPNRNILVLNENYSPNWRMNGRSSDFEINGYANGWIINQKNTKVTIAYKSQTLLEYGFIISAVIFIVICIILILYKIKKYGN